MQPLRLAVDARVVAEDTRGIGRYARAVLQRLAARDDVELTLLEFGPFAFRHRGALARAIGSARFAVRSRAGAQTGVVWHPANGTFFTSRAPNVATIHDAVPFLSPDPDPKRRAHEQDPFLRSARTAARVITDSAFARQDVHELLGIPLERIDVVHLGVDPSFTPGAADSLPGGLVAGEYLLFVGPIAEPRKNFGVLFEAYLRAWRNGAGPKLAIVGPDAPDAPGIVRLKALADGELRALYRGALALTLPAYHEAFGLPAIEAMACGTPVVASRASALPEVGGDAASYVEPEDTGGWTAALQQVASDAALRARMRTAGLENAKRFDWDECAERTLNILRSVAEGGA